MRQAILILLILFGFAGAQGQAAATLVLVHGRIWTENPSQPEAEAIAVRGNRILAVGTSAKILKWAGKHARVIDLKGKRVVPGFNDAHTHFMDAADALTSVHLQGARTPQEFRSRVAAFVKTMPAGEWMTHGNWSAEGWPDGELPTHALIDDVTPINPVAVWSVDGHSVLANALAMQIAGVGRETKDVVGGVIVRDAGGAPTGFFRDAATALIASKMPPMTEVQMHRATTAGLNYAAEHGVTSLQSLAGYIGDDRQFGFLHFWQRAEEEKWLTVRISVYPAIEEWQQVAQEKQSPRKNALVRLGGVKAFADGSMGSHTAWLSYPYEDQPQTAGIASAELHDSAKLLSEIVAADAAGVQVAIHAIGDKANHEVLNLFEQAEAVQPSSTHRFRIEHAQLLQTEDMQRFARLHVIASMQPYHEATAGVWAEKRIGKERSARAYAWRSLLDNGTTLAFGSDWPVAPMDPLMGIYAATTRRTLDGKNSTGWMPQQRVTVTEAVHAYTLGAAYAEFQEKEKGSLEPGKLADVVVLTDDIFRVDPVLIEKARINMTIFNGKVVYEQNAKTR